MNFQGFHRHPQTTMTLQLLHCRLISLPTQRNEKLPQMMYNENRHKISAPISNTPPTFYNHFFITTRQCDKKFRPHFSLTPHVSYVLTPEGKVFRTRPNFLISKSIMAEPCWQIRTIIRDTNLIPTVSSGLKKIPKTKAFLRRVVQKHTLFQMAQM